MSSTSPAYQSALQNVVWRDCSHFGRFLLRGRDAANLLHHLTTNDIKKLQPDTGCDAALITAKGRLLDWLSIFRVDDGFFVITSPNRRDIFAPHARSFVLFRQDVKIEDVTETSSLWATFGAKALDENAVLNHIERDGGEFQAATNRLPLGGKWHWTMSKTTPPIELPSVDGPTYNILRVESGLPVAGAEISEDFNPWEAGLDASISLHKGCYNGQEIVARLNTYQKIKQRLRGVRFNRKLSGNLTLQDDSGEKSRVAGRVTSSVLSPRFGPIGLAYVRDEWSSAGSTLQVLADGQSVGEATVCDLPFGV